jgi:periplasmic protein TonB
MLAYAASRPVVAHRGSSPNAMLAIIAAHVAVIAVVMSAKMDLPRRVFDPPIVIRTIPIPAPPPPNAIKPTPQGPSTVYQPTPLRPLPIPYDPIVQPGPVVFDPGTAAGPVIGPDVTPALQLILVRRGAELLTPAAELKPPYPESKLASGEEALLRLRLTIDERGRVVAVEPIGRADSTFLVAARRHLMARWRYRPASENGRAVTSTTVITLRFQLDG